MKAPSEMERLRRSAKDAKVRSTFSVAEIQFPGTDVGHDHAVYSATDTDVIGARDAKHATNVLEHEPFVYSTICGGGETKLRGDLATHLVTLRSAPIVMSSQDSIVPHSTLHDEDYTMVSGKLKKALLSREMAWR